MNIGEYSEIYVFLKLLADGKLWRADKHLNRIQGDFFPIVSVFRQTQNSTELEYIIEPDINKNINIIKISGNFDGKNDIEAANFDIISNEILWCLKNNQNIEIKSGIVDFLESIGNPVIKQNSNLKQDINLTAYDLKISRIVDLGFSIKSKIGGASTLFNAGKNTNITFSITGKFGEYENFKNLKTKKLLSFLNDNNFNVSFDHVISNQFKSNLKIIDSLMDVILAECLKVYYSQNISSVSQIIDQIEILDPCNYGDHKEQNFYRYKMKQFLTACALGLTAGKIWNGYFDANGGYIIVKEDGEIVCYHIYNWNEFQEYLFENTFFDTPSTTRHDFGYVFSENNQYYLNLNAQIRFK